MREEKTVYYDKNDMLDLWGMPNDEIANLLEILQRDLINKYRFLDNDPDCMEYSDDEYREYAIQVALAKADKILRSSK